MSSHANSSNHTEPHPPLIALRKWIKQIGISNVTAWRWAKSGMIHPVNIAGKRYLTVEDLAQFKRRAKEGAFAKGATGAANKAPKNA